MAATKNPFAALKIASKELEKAASAKKPKTMTVEEALRINREMDKKYPSKK